jgi:hypothetical protein
MDARRQQRSRVLEHDASAIAGDRLRTEMTMIRLTILALVALIVTVGVASAGEVTREFRNEKGQIVGTATTNSNGQTTYRNDRGQVTGTSTTRANQTIFFDPMGRQQGTATSPGRR